jgi:hypothetical protein
MLVVPPNVEQPQVQETILKIQGVIAAAGPNLSDAESRELEELLTEYGDISAMKTDDYGQTNGVYCSIDTGEARPI